MPDDSPARERIIAGAMSGTSADGVDVAITRIIGRGTSMTAQLLHHHHRSYDAATRSEIFAFRGGEASANLARLAELGRTISLTYATTINEALAASRLSAADLAAVAAHGQTLYHAPPNTIQWFDPSLVAAEVGCPVVSDFRRADLAAGGQGAPLVPFADYVLFRHPQLSRALINIGGIANVTLLHGEWPLERTLAFDTGPGNCISDYLCRTRDPHGPGYDVGGQRAMRGRVIMALAERVLLHNYFRQPPPKSTDGPDMIRIFEKSLAEETRPHPLDDLLATACWITVGSVTHAIKSVWGAMTDEAIVSGGGAKNEMIFTWLRDSCDSLARTDDLGIPADAKEALAFALLAAATLDGEPSNVPSVTGAKRAVVLGSITPSPSPSGRGLG
ncbi:MAG TPA: anhydro-N-acetylmuramic acid kinase [Tepidisphaeraceae bacterium]|nr:anhydro-N-acetylmuramic acid kinase [Tepidisphaeraceae bacterium]